MQSEKRQKILNYLNDQIAQADFKANAYVYNEENKKKPQRNIFIKMENYLNDFLKGDTAIRWITLTGLRGAGKTTILSQIYSTKRQTDCYKLFLSADQITQLLGSDLNEVLSVYEEIIGSPFESLDKPLVLFLDEIQYDPKWGIALKSIYDRSNKVFIFATGSSALSINSNTDIARRTIYEKLFPLSFSEYLKVKNGKYEVKGLGSKIRDALFFAKDGKSAYQKFSLLENEIEKHYMGINRMEFSKYIHYGSLPFMIALKNEALVYDQISKTLDRIINNDIASIGNFGSEIISKIPAILYAVADMDAISFNKIADTFDISRPKVAEIFQLLEKTETLIRIHPHGSHLNQAKKPSKYLFSSPAFRAMYYKTVGNIISPENTRGKLLEDLVGMYLNRILYKKTAVSLTYDSSEGGADFILGIGNRKLIIEVGAGKKDYRQIINTSKKIKTDYNIIISQDPLEYSKELNAIKVPLKIFLLI